MNIPEKLIEIKTWLRTNSGKTFIIIIVLIVSNITSFNLGRQNTNKNIVSRVNNTIEENIPNNNDYSLADPELTENNKEFNPRPGSLAAAIMTQNDLNREEGIKSNPASVNQESSPRYVASKKGRVYYFTWCAGAKNILLENKIYFNSAKDARAAGLNPSKSCPDLD